MRQEITVTRTLPVNLTPKDLALFQGSKQVTFERLHPVHLKNVWILQDTIFSPGEMRFYSSHTHIADIGPLQFAKRAIYCAPKSWKKIPLGMWVLDEWSANYFHWMTDCLPRIWEGIEREPDCPVILPESFKSLDYVIQSLDLAGVTAVFFKASQNLHVKKLILTARTATFPNFNPPLADKTRTKLSVKSISEPWRKVYISRKLAPKRKAHNDADVEILLQKRGFDVVYAEKLSLSQQIQLMSETQLLVCLHGAALTNMLFLPPTAKVLEFRNHGDSVSQCYFNLSSALGLAYYYTLNQGDGKHTIMSDFTIDLVSLEHVLDQIDQTTTQTL
ncbi:glycosyltransferase family 61 protein [Algoriphagus terrigena]|uniref:glycosyltransferase family 61 protein n=1 Tax=Algoriphagus terrigena TaxID=344884 RepID=UPI000406B108|nr:glycosyltransferase family 61 protein [Algoriphagus terrigena]